MSVLSRVELYLDSEEKWRFRAVALNGETVAVGEGYENKQDCRDEAEKLWPDAAVEDAS